MSLSSIERIPANHTTSQNVHKANKAMFVKAKSVAQSRLSNNDNESMDGTAT